MANDPHADKDVLGEHWFPVGEVSIESIRERSAFTALPPHYALHVWFARRPLVTSRAAIAAALLPVDFNHDAFLHLCGIPHNIDIIGIYREFLRAKAEKRPIENPFTWPRAFIYTPHEDELISFNRALMKILHKDNPLLYDPFAGGGSIPLEANRLGLNIICNDLNPVAFICLKGTIEYPSKFGRHLVPKVEEFCNKIFEISALELEKYFPKPDGSDIFAYLWARTIRCPHCGYTIPLSPNWWIVNSESQKIAAKPVKNIESRNFHFEIVENPNRQIFDPNKGTTSRGDAVCINCQGTINGEFIKNEAQENRLGHQLFGVCSKIQRTRGRQAWKFRIPTSEEYSAIIAAEKEVAKNLDIWITEGVIPSEEIPDGLKTKEPHNFGIKYWYQFFNPRQLLTHATYLKAFRDTKAELFESLKKDTKEWEFAEAIVVYGSIVFDTCVNYNSLQARWHSGRKVIAGAMDMQAFPFRASYAEFDHSSMLWPWATKKALKTLREIQDLNSNKLGSSTIIVKPAQDTNIAGNSIDCIVTDPPYSENVMYAEISDFFYVWLNRLIGDLFPDVFLDSLTNKIDEAVSNPSRFSDAARGQASLLAAQDYAAKMEASFRECRRVLQDEGTMCVMFTHRTPEAWAGLAESLMNAGFILRSSWPVHTEPGQKFGKADKGNLKVTVLLYCRKRTDQRPGRWESVVEEIRNITREKVDEYDRQGIKGPDLLVSVYGPALGIFSEYYPVRDVTGRVKHASDALIVVAQVVNEYLTGDIQGADMDSLAYLNLLRLNPGLVVEEDFARIVTVFGGNTSVDRLDIRDGAGLVKKRKGKVTILTSKDRMSEGVLSPNRPDQFKGLMDVVHAALIVYEQKGLEAVTRLLEETGRDSRDTGVLNALAVIGNLREDAADNLIAEAMVATALQEALGRTPTSIRRSGEKITDYLE